MVEPILLEFLILCESWVARLREQTLPGPRPALEARARACIITKLDEARFWAMEALALREEGEEEDIPV